MWLEIPGQTHNTDNERVSVTMEWPREKIVQLIECYRGYPLLWDPTHALYKHRFKRADAWREIAENIQMGRNEVEKKMKNLVTQFRRELKKCQEKKSGDGAEDAYKSQGFALSIMVFLADKHKPHKTYDAEYQLSADNASTVANAEECTGNMTQDEATVEGDKCSRRSTSGVNVAAPTKIGKMSLSQTLKINDDDMLQKAYGVLAGLHRRFNDRDEHQIFADLISTKLRKLKTPYAQNKIQNTIFEAEQGIYDKPPQYHPHISPPLTDNADCDVTVHALDVSLE
ncbi:uncharacterized protein [Palaemon carinicauda]|uniref:uncharacterized protein n=1 Tax=Palaemon carinicauda TaxID=392227 RepID=UPI0035B5A585